MPCHTRLQEISRKSLNKGMLGSETCGEEQGGSCSQHSKTSGLRSACKYGLQLTCASGKYVTERHDFLCTAER